MHLLTAALFIVTLLGCVYLIAAIALLLRFGRRTPARADTPLPSVTVLKPLAGAEPGLYHALASWCEQDHLDYDVVFCVHSEDDPAVAVARRVMLDYPRCRALLLIGDDPAMRNPKMANLAKAEDAIAAELIVIADSDARADANFLRALCGSFAERGVGAATCLYRAEPRGGFISQLGAAYVDDQFAPSVLVATAIGPLRFCLGAVMAVRRDVLQQIGGFQALGPYLADDHRLGELVTEAGYRVDLSRCVVAIAVEETRFGDLWAHELRWARTSMAQAPIGYAFSFLMLPVPPALLYLILARFSAAGWLLLAFALALRVGLHYAAADALSVRRASMPWIAPVRDLVSFALWFVSLCGRRVRWRQTAVNVDRNGRMTDTC